MSDETKVPLVEGNLDGTPTEPAQSNNLKSMMDTLSGLPVTPGAAKSWISSRRQNIRPWSEFLNSGRFKKPAPTTIPKRAMKNVDYFMSNYLFVFLGLVVFCILTSPILLIVIGLCGAALYHVNNRDKNNPVRILGRILTPSQSYIAVGTASVPLLWLSGAGSAVFWILGASLLLIGAHAAMYEPIEGEEFDMEMEEVVIS